METIVNRRPLYQVIAHMLQAIENCNTMAQAGGPDAGHYAAMAERHATRLHWYVENYMPYGSGFDGGTRIDTAESTPDKLVFRTAFHHMNANGYYTRWTDHKVTVRPSLAFGYTLKIGGRDHDGIKEYMADVFAESLDRTAYAEPDESKAA